MKLVIGKILRFARYSALCAAPAVLSAQPPQPAPAPPAAPAITNAPEIYRLMGVGGTFLGVGVREVDSERAKALKLKEEYGVEITKVEDESPAAKAGLKVGDVVLEFNGQRVEGTEQFVRLVRETPSGRAVKLLVSRGGANQTIAATLATRKAGALYSYSGPSEGFKVEVPRMEMVMPDIPKAMMSWRSAVLGVEAESLGESQLATYFGVKDGVLVRSVMKGTAAEKAGIKAGDVLLKVDDTKVSTPRDVTSSIRSARSSSRNSVQVVLMREKREMTVSVPLDEETSEKPPAPRIQKMSVKQPL